FQVPLRRGVEIVRGINQRLSGIQKTFKYIMSHYTGKIEILDLGDDNRVYMRYHQNKVPEKIGKIFSRRYVEEACWLDDLEAAYCPPCRPRRSAAAPGAVNGPRPGAKGSKEESRRRLRRLRRRRWRSCDAAATRSMPPSRRPGRCRSASRAV